MSDTGHAAEWPKTASLAMSAGTNQALSRPLREKVYVPGGATGIAAWREMFTEIWDCRELTYRLFLRDFTARYRQSLLGYLWALMPALATVGTFSALRQANVIPTTPSGLPYPLFVLIGISVWQLFASGLTMSTQSLVFASSFITKINFPREALVFASFGLSLFEFAIRCVLVGAAFAVCKIMPPAAALLMPLAVVPLALLTLGLGLLLGLLNTITRDVGQIIAFVLPFWMLLTPVAYSAPRQGAIAWLSVVNPITPFVTAVQDLTMRGELSRPGEYLLASVLGLAVFLIGWRLFHGAEARIAELV